MSDFLPRRSLGLLRYQRITERNCRGDRCGPRLSMNPRVITKWHHRWTRIVSLQWMIVTFSLAGACLNGNLDDSATSTTDGETSVATTVADSTIGTDSMSEVGGPSDSDFDTGTDECPSPPEYVDGLQIDIPGVLRLGSRVTASVGGEDTLFVCGGSFVQVIKSNFGDHPDDCCFEPVPLDGNCTTIARNDSYAVAGSESDTLTLFRILGDGQLLPIQSANIPEIDGGRIYEIVLHNEQVYVAAGKAGLLRFAIVSGELKNSSNLPGDYVDVRGVTPIGDALLIADAERGVVLADAGEGTVHQSYFNPELAPATGSVVSEERAAIFHGPGPITILELGPDNFSVHPVPLETAGTPTIGGFWEGDQLLLFESARIWRVDFRSGFPEILSIEERPRFGQPSGLWLTGLARSTPRKYSVISGSEIFPLMVGDDNPSPNLSVVSMTKRFAAMQSGAEVTVPFRNVGTVPLVLTGIHVDEPFQLGEVWPELVPSSECQGRYTVAQGETFRLSVKSQQTVESNIVSSIRLKSNDPSRSEVDVRMIANPATLAIGQSAPNFVLPDLFGKIEELPHQLGKVVLLVFVNYSQPSDRSDLQYVASELIPKFRDKGFVVLAINSGRKHSGVVAKWVQEDGLEFPVLFDAESEVLSSYWVGPSHFPRSVVIDREGKVAVIDLESGFAASEPAIASLLDLEQAIE